MEAATALPATVKADRQEKPDLPRYQKWFRAFETNKRRELEEAQEGRRYYHDKQWSDLEKRRLNSRGQQDTTRNRIKRKVDFLVGVEQRLRRDPKGYPRTPKHEHDADTATGALRFVADQNQWPKISSDCMHDGLVSGIGVVFIGIEGEDPCVRHVDADRYFYDPRSSKSDFSDARYMGLHLWFDIDEAKERWPESEKSLDDVMDASSTNGGTSVMEQDREQQWGDFEGRRVRIVEFWEKRRDGWHFCYFTGDVVLESGVSPYKDEKGRPDCPYEAWSPYIDEKGDRYGIVRTLRSIQDEINYSASKMLWRLSTRQFFYKKGAVDDPDEFARQLARPDGRIEIQEHAKWGDDIGPVDDNAKLQGEAERFQMAVMEMENYGPNPGLVGQGQGVDGASGRALMAQRDSGMTELQPVFDRQRDWKLRCYRKMWARVRQAWTAERFIRITDDENSLKFIQLNQFQMDPMTGQIMANNQVAEIDVDIILEEGPDTITMNEELLDQFTKLGEAAMSPLGKIVIELSNTPKKEQLIRMIDEGMQAMQPGPDPAIELKQQELQLKGQEMMAKGQQDQMKGQIDMAIADKNLQIKDAELQLKHMDMQQRQQEAVDNRQMKMIEIDAEERRFTHEERMSARQLEATDRKAEHDSSLFRQKQAQQSENRPNGS